MTCADLSAILAERPLSSLSADQRAQVKAHLAECPGCRTLFEAIDGINRMPVPQSLFSPKEIAPVRPMPSRAWFIAMAFMLPLLLAVLGVLWKGSYGWDALPSEAAALYAILGVGALAALTLGFYRQFKPGARDTIDGRAAMAVLLLGFVAFISVEFGWHPKPGFALASAWRCLSFGVEIALVASLALLSWARQGFAANPHSASFWTGALASMAGMIALAVHCPNLELSHLLMGHATVILVTSCLAAWTGRRWFGLR